jgi:hypothetical protein
VPELPLRLLSPEYVAVKVLLPVTVGVSEQLKVGSVAWQVDPATPLSVTVNVPVGVPPKSGVTVNTTVTG